MVKMLPILSVITVKCLTFVYFPNEINACYWIVRKIRADFEGKLKRRRFKFLISFIKFKSFARTFRTTQYIEFPEIDFFHDTIYFPNKRSNMSLGMILISHIDVTVKFDQPERR